MKNWMISRRRLVTAIVLAVGIASALSFRLSYPRSHTDEITYMSSALESMIQKSVFQVKGNGTLFINKPPLSLWLIRLSFELAEPGFFTARLPSVLAAAATAAVLYLFGAAVFGEGAGILAALFFAFTPGLLVLHGIRSATPDSLEILLVTLAIVSLELWRRRRRPWMLTCLVAFAAVSAWVKSPFALVVLLAYLLVTELPARRAGRGTPRFGATVALVAGVWTGVYLLWLCTLSLAFSPRVAKGLLLHQYLARIEGRLSPAHVHGPSFYLVSLLSDFGPLLLLPAGAAVAAWLASRRQPSRPGGPPFVSPDVACLVVWSLAAPVLATASASKLAWYAYLSYPGIALLLAVSAYRLAQAVSGRPFVKSTVLAASVLLLAWRLPIDQVWPAEPARLGPAGRLWEIASRDPRIEVIPGSGFRLPDRGDSTYREARLLIRMLFWQQSQRSSGSGSFASFPGHCRAILVNYPGAVPAGADALELYRPLRGGVSLSLIDRCDGRLRRQLTADPLPPAVAADVLRGER